MRKYSVELASALPPVQVDADCFAVSISGAIEFYNRGDFKDDELVFAIQKDAWVSVREVK